MSFVCIDGQKTFYKREGSGKTVLLLHGWGGNNESFAPVFDSLKGRFDVVALDFWGFGQSGLPPAPADTFWYAQKTKAFADALGIKSAFVIAHSFGARVALVLAADCPEFVEKLAIVDGAGMKPRFSLKKKIKEAKYKICRYLAKRGLIKEKKLQKFGSEDYKALVGVMKATFVRVVNDYLEEKAKNTKAETLLIWGKKDKDTPLYMAKRLRRLIKNSGLVLFEKAGHFSYLEEFCAFDAIIKSFFSEKYGCA